MQKWKVGYTTGVFDLFHIGHLNILRKAKEQCDYLIVGVSTDEVVWESKHKMPVVPFAERLEIVRAIRYVDEVAPEETLDKKAAWERLRFDVIFHGDDRKGSARYNVYEEQFEKLGVNVVYFPYSTGTSSTMLSELLRRRLAEREDNGE
jgi:glycerol-3-phosphate cytidylyltransferase